MSTETEINRPNVVAAAESFVLASHAERARVAGDSGKMPSADAKAATSFSEVEFLRELGKRLRKLRESCDMSRRTLSSGSGVSERYIALIEGGKGNVSVVLLLRLLHALHHPVAGGEAADVLPVARDVADGAARSTQSSLSNSDDGLRRNNVFRRER